MSLLETIIIGLILIANLGFLISCIAILIGGSFGAPFIPTGRRTAERMIAAAELTKGDTVWDIGCGDGRLLITAVRAGAGKAIGVEISPPVWLLAKLRVWLSGYSQQIDIRLGNIFAAKWYTELQQADVVFCFLLPNMMQRVMHELYPLMPAGARLVSHAFQATDRKLQPNKTLPRTKHSGSVHIYKKP